MKWPLFLMPISHVTYIHTVGVMFFASNLSSLRKKLSRHATTSWYWCFCPRKGGGESSLIWKKKAANSSSRITNSWMTSLTVDESEKYFYHMKYLHRFYMSSRYLDFTRTAFYHSQFKITVISLILGALVHLQMLVTPYVCTTSQNLDTYP